MSLDIGLASARTTEPYPSMRLSFDDDGCYWFCYPFFEALVVRTGEMIDLYGDAWFAGAAIGELERTLDEIEKSAATMPHMWDVCIGYSGGSNAAPTPPAPIYRTVNRAEVLALLRRFSDLAAEARQARGWVACVGD